MYEPLIACAVGGSNSIALTNGGRVVIWGYGPESTIINDPLRWEKEFVLDLWKVLIIRWFKYQLESITFLP